MTHVIDALYPLAAAVLGINAVVAAHRIIRLEKRVRELEAKR